MRTPVFKRLPIVAGLLIGFVVAGFIHAPVGVRILVFLGSMVAWELVLRLVFGVPWTRILRYREPEEPSTSTARVGERT